MMKKIFQISLITSVLATCGFAGEGTFDIYDRVDFNGNDIDVNLDIKASGYINIAKDSTLNALLSLQSGAQMDIPAGKTITNTGEIKINPGMVNSVQITKCIGKKIFYEYLNNNEEKVYADCQNAVPGVQGFYSADGKILQEQPTEVKKSYHQKVTGAPTGEGIIDMAYRDQVPETHTLPTTIHVRNGTGGGDFGILEEYKPVGKYYVYVADFDDINDFTLIYSKTLVMDTIASINASSTDLGNPSDVLCYGWTQSQIAGNKQEEYFYLTSLSRWYRITNVRLKSASGPLGKITGGVATLEAAGNATLNEDNVELNNTVLSAIGTDHKFVLTSCLNAGGWQEEWIKSLPKIQYTDTTPQTYTFGLGLEEIGENSAEEYLNQFGIIPDSVIDNRENAVSTIDLLSSKSGDDAIKILAGENIVVDNSATISANIHNVGVENAITTFSGQNLLTLSGINQCLSGTTTFECPVQIAGEKSIPGGDVIFKKKLTVDADTEIIGNIALGSDSEITINSGRIAKVYGTMSL